MEYLKENYENKPKAHIDKIDKLLKELYDRKISIETFFFKFNNQANISFEELNEINGEKLLKKLIKFIKSIRNESKLKIKRNYNEIKYYYSSSVNNINESNSIFIYKKNLELIGNFYFGDKGFNTIIDKIPETKREKIENYLFNQANSFLEKKTFDDNAIYEFIKFNHLLFLTDDDFQFLCLRFFLIINDFLLI